MLALIVLTYNYNCLKTTLENTEGVKFPLLFPIYRANSACQHISVIRSYSTSNLLIALIRKKKFPEKAKGKCVWIWFRSYLSLLRYVRDELTYLPIVESRIIIPNPT